MPQFPGHDKYSSLKRDILCDFCLTCKELEEQFARLEQSGSLSFAIMRDLVGDKMSKGSLWRLKDTSHYLFNAMRLTPDRSAAADETERAEDPAGARPGLGCTAKEEAGFLLDWTLGYIFHECVKMTEDAYQLQYYGPRLPLLPEGGGSPCEDVLKSLAPIVGQSRTSLLRETRRVALLLEQARRLFCLYLSGERDNLSLALFIYDRSSLVLDTFHAYYEDLLKGIYGESLDIFHLQAARAFFAFGHKRKSIPPVEEALRLNPANAEAAELYKTLADNYAPD